MGANQSSVEAAEAVTAENTETIDQTLSDETSTFAPVQALCKSTSSNSIVGASHSAYNPPTTPIDPAAHYVFLVHGIMGNDLEMGYLAKALANVVGSKEVSCDDGNEEEDEAKRIKRSTSKTSTLLESKPTPGPEVCIHSVKCNVGQTHDGIRSGGTRLANEMLSFVQNDMKKRVQTQKQKGEYNVTFSIVGNSLGGLYARYAVSLLPYQLRINARGQAQEEDKGSIKSDDGTIQLNLHPNVFYTTATPHLGCSRKTYLPIPRFAESIIGPILGATGRDLFRLDTKKDPASNALDGLTRGVVDRLGIVAKGEKLLWAKENDSNDGEGDDDAVLVEHAEEQELECVIRNMCLQDKYLASLRNFKRRVAYANAFGTDFQVPTETAAFLHERSGVGHFVEATRDDDASDDDASDNDVDANDGKRKHSGVDDSDGNTPSFLVAIVKTEEQSQPQTPTSKADPNENVDFDSPSDELLRMSQSLDALGWTKVFVDVRDRIPAPQLAKPTFLRPKNLMLDDLIRKRMLENSNVEGGTERQKCILTSSELFESSRTGDSINIPLGHAVMVANSKSEKYGEFNREGRPVMDFLAADMIRDIMLFE